MQLWRPRILTVCCLQAADSRKDGGVIQSMLEGLKTRKADGGISSPRPKARKLGAPVLKGMSRCPSSKREKYFVLSSPFLLSWHSSDWMRPTHIGEGGSSLHSLLIQILML
jgi:hypothetical protein